MNASTAKMIASNANWEARIAGYSWTEEAKASYTAEVKALLPRPTSSLRAEAARRGISVPTLLLH